MKKSLVSALTTALVVGAASTTFAAANPFSDVPADHWAYDAVAQLAAEGVVEGYGDGTFAGGQEITRYEMAQMVAKAMAKGATSAQLDKLAAEFAEELNSLGVRVAALEKKVDNVKFSGEARYTARRKIVKDTPAETDNKMVLRLKMDAQVNKNWTVKARFDYQKAQNGKTSEDIGLDHVEYAYAQGKYGKATIDLGKYEFVETVSEGGIFDATATGLQVAYAPTKEVKVTAMAGRANEKRFGVGNDAALDVWGVRAEYAAKKLSAGAGFYKFGKKTDEAKIWVVGVGYRFDKNFRLYGNYARNNKSNDGKQKKEYVIEVDYKGADIAKRGSYGAHIAYKYLGQDVVTATTYDYADRGMKGIELGADYVLDKNVLLNLGYFNGKQIEDNKKAQILFSRIHFYF
ncbi:MAG: putative porin [Selenomonadaceae bacterium]|nr:putative porin [Selenomonadaceae bacterium]